jgi:hypothetical protein
LITFLGLNEPQEPIAVSYSTSSVSRYFNLVSGVGHFDRNGSSTLTYGLFCPLLMDVTASRFRTDLRHTNVYAYSYLNPLRKVTVTLGLSGDFTDGESPDIKGIEPS